MEDYSEEELGRLAVADDEEAGSSAVSDQELGGGVDGDQAKVN